MQAHMIDQTMCSFLRQILRKRVMHATGLAQSIAEWVAVAWAGLVIAGKAALLLLLPFLQVAFGLLEYEAAREICSTAVVMIEQCILQHPKHVPVLHTKYSGVRIVFTR